MLLLNSDLDVRIVRLRPLFTVRLEFLSFLAFIVRLSRLLRLKKISDEIPSEESSSKVYEEFYQDLEEEIEAVIETPIAEEKQQDDDLLIVEDYSPTNKNKYKHCDRTQCLCVYL